MAALATSVVAIAAAKDLLVGALLEALQAIRAAFGLSPLPV
jgi:hypothetical protein